MDKYIRLAIRAAVDAGLKIHEIYESTFEVDYKIDGSPLTSADTEANAIIVSYLKQTNIPLISEELEIAPFSVRKNYHQCWMIDPLDGTKEFLNRNGEFTVNIALLENQKPVFGVIYIPETKELYYTYSKQLFKVIFDNDYSDSFIENHSDKIIRKKNELLKVAVSKSHLSEQTTTFINELKQTNAKIETVALGSSLKFCYLAEGIVDVYPRLSPTMEWDTAAGHAICNAVGIKMNVWGTNEEVIYNKQDLKSPFFLVKA